MQKNNTTHGFGLSVFSLFLLAVAFLLTIYLDKCIIASIIAFLSAILATAAYIESRKANGPRKTILVILIIAIFGTIFSFLRTASISREQEKQEQIIDIESEKDETKTDKAEKLKELEEKIEELESNGQK